MRVLVIGAGPAGLAAASRVRRLRRDAEVVVLERSRWLSFGLCGLPLYLHYRVPHLEQLRYYGPEEFKRRGIDVRLGWEATSIDPESKLVVARGPSGSVERISYDKLIVATGAKARVPSSLARHLELPNVAKLYRPEDAAKARVVLARSDAKRVVIVGGGYIGLEAADAARRLGKSVVVVDPHYPLHRALDSDVAELLRSRLEWMGFEQGRVVDLEVEGGEARAALLEGGGRVEGDAFIIATGVEPSVELLREAGAEVGVTGAVKVNARMETSLPDIYAAGDCVETVNRVTGEPTWHPFAPTANRMGYVAGANAAGANLEFPGVVGTTATVVGDVVVASTGLRESDARTRGFDVVVASLDAHTRARYTGEPGWVHLKVVADASTGRLLGAQALGSDDSAFWRVNVVASLLERGATAWDLFNVDLGYMPLLNPVWDPLTVAARLLLRSLRK